MPQHDDLVGLIEAVQVVAWLNRVITSSAAAWSLSLTARTDRPGCAHEEPSGHREPAVGIPFDCHREFEPGETADCLTPPG